VNQGSDNVSAFAIAPATGVMTPIGGSPFPVVSGTGPISVSADPLGLYLYVANETSNNVSAFTINEASGALLAIGSPVPATSPQSITVDLSGQFVYVANGTLSNNVSAFVVQANGGLINTSTVTGSPFAAGSNPSAITTVGQF
jgi:6-phosphogluconolactonase (cycloisomerase 2 family)